MVHAGAKQKAEQKVVTRAPHAGVCQAEECEPETPGLWLGGVLLVISEAGEELLDIFSFFFVWLEDR